MARVFFVLVIVLALASGCSSSPSKYHLPEGCELVKVQGNVDYVVVFFENDELKVSEPGDGIQRPIEPPSIMTMRPNTQTIVAVFYDDRKKPQAFPYSLHEHGPPKQFCLLGKKSKHEKQKYIEQS